MSRIILGFHLTKKRKHIFTTSFVLISIAVIFSYIIIISGDNAGQLINSLMLSLFRLVSAYAISLVVATIVAIFISNSRFGDMMIPIFDLLQNIPSFALIPLFIYWFGYTNMMTIIFAATSILWPILFYVLHSLKTVRRELDDAAKIFGAVGIKRVLYFLMPVAFPSLVTGSIVGFSIGWEAIIGVEIIGLASGIGQFLNTPVGNNNNQILGISALLIIVFLINRLIWMPLLRKSQLYAA
ncbi:MAG: ABC transporter permease subunit [Candidatus Taylorbacteria bacterium]